MDKGNGQRENLDRYQLLREHTLMTKSKAMVSFTGQAGTCTKEILRMTKDTEKGK